MTGRTPQQAGTLFAELVARFSALPSVTPPSGSQSGKFGVSALKVDGKIFAMLSGDALIVKLPRQRVEELIASGTGTPFDPGHGRVMNEWVTIPPSDGRSWATLAEEARRFVAATRRR